MSWLRSMNFFRYSVLLEMFRSICSIFVANYYCFTIYRGSTMAPNRFVISGPEFGLGLEF